MDGVEFTVEVEGGVMLMHGIVVVVVCWEDVGGVSDGKGCNCTLGLGTSTLISSSAVKILLVS